MKKSLRVSLCALLSLSNFGIAHAGSYPTNPSPLPNGAGANVDAGQSWTAPANVNLPPQTVYSPATQQPLEVQSSYDWTWTPAGPIATDPAPKRAVNLFYGMSGGPVKITITGQGWGTLITQLVPEKSLGTAAYQQHMLGRTSTYTFPSPATATQSAVIPSSSSTLEIISQNKLRFTSTVTAQATSQVSASNGGTAKVEFNTLHIGVTGLTLQP